MIRSSELRDQRPASWRTCVPELVSRGWGDDLIEVTEQTFGIREVLLVPWDKTPDCVIEDRLIVLQATK